MNIHSVSTALVLPAVWLYRIVGRPALHHFTNTLSLSLQFNSHYPRGPRYQNVSTLDFTGAKGDEGAEWWQLELYDVQNSSQNVTTNKPTPSFFTGRMPFLMTIRCTVWIWVESQIKSSVRAGA